jgi:hypothetical protein
MNRVRLTKKLTLWMILACSSFILVTGCGPKVKYVVPPLKEKAVLKVPLADRPELDEFTPVEMKAVPRSAHGKILKNQAAWWGYADIADSAIKAHEEYELTIFGGEVKLEPKAAPETPAKGWKFWK